MLQREPFIVELFTINTLASSTISLGEIATLAHFKKAIFFLACLEHEILNNTVELGNSYFLTVEKKVATLQPL